MTTSYNKKPAIENIPWLVSASLTNRRLCGTMQATLAPNAGQAKEAAVSVK
jgi:hypothetical protein